MRRDSREGACRFLKRFVGRKLSDVILARLILAAVPFRDSSGRSIERRLMYVYVYEQLSRWRKSRDCVRSSDEDLFSEALFSNFFLKCRIIIVALDVKPSPVIFKSFRELVLSSLSIENVRLYISIQRRNNTFFAKVN